MHILEQLGYNFGGAKFIARNTVSSVLELDKDFAEKPSDETKSFLSNGLALRYSENHPEVNQSYIKVDSNYIKADEKVFKAHKGEKVILSVSFLLAESPAKFGRLKADNLALYELMQPKRRAINNYINDAIKDMQSLAKKILNELAGVTTVRNPNKLIGEKINGHFDKMQTELKTAKSKGEITDADIKRFSDAKVEFMIKWNHA